MSDLSKLSDLTAYASYAEDATFSMEWEVCYLKSWYCNICHANADMGHWPAEDEPHLCTACLGRAYALWPDADDHEQAAWDLFMLVDRAERVKRRMREEAQRQDVPWIWQFS